MFNINKWQNLWIIWNCHCIWLYMKWIQVSDASLNTNMQLWTFSISKKDTNKNLTLCKYKCIYPWSTHLCTHTTILRSNLKYFLDAIRDEGRESFGWNLQPKNKVTNTVFKMNLLPAQDPLQPDRDVWVLWIWYNTEFVILGRFI